MEIRTSLRDLRTAQGLSAADLAKRAGVSRQTIYAIEDGSFVPNTAVALRLARILDVEVEQIFALDEPPGAADAVDAQLLSGDSGSVREGQLVRLCRVQERLIAAPVPAFPAYLPTADGVVWGEPGRRVAVKAVSDRSHKRAHLLVAGCDPAISLLADELNSSEMEIIGIPCSSRRALKWLQEGGVHAAGSHLLDSASGHYNVPMVKRLFPRGDVRIVTFATWEQGLVIGRGNPKGIRGVADIARKGVTIINREKGSGSRDLLEKGLHKAGVEATRIAGYDTLATGHLAAAYAVASGAADCCIANRSAARCFGLDFIPLAVERFDLSFSKASLGLRPAKALLNLLNGSSLKQKLAAIAGYDTAHTGEVLA
jgi:molybdate-binding protein/DNA-binding XRE family transcriptional regulator